MWHAGFFSSIFLLIGPYLAGAQLFSEGGSNAWAQKQPLPNKGQQPPLTNIVDELNALRNLQKQQYEAEQLYVQQPSQFDSYEQPSQYVDNEVDDGTSQLELAKIGADIQKLLKEQEDAEALVGGQQEQATGPVIQQLKQEKPAADQQKRGQNEFVEFIEPHASKALKNVEYMDKRAPVSEIDGPNGSHYLYYSSNNVLFIVGVTVASVFVIAGVVGGAYHVNNIRKQRNEAFDDFTRYSPAGPGRDMLRRGRGYAGSPVTDLGDDALAKAAHLHHYQQTKQKIIGSDNGINDHEQDGSDEENEDLAEEHNFSIYECPGLAMSGDIEVKNPNFDAQQNP